jgi:hypothetical protein
MHVRFVPCAFDGWYTERETAQEIYELVVQAEPLNARTVSRK